MGGRVFDICVPNTGEIRRGAIGQQFTAGRYAVHFASVTRASTQIPIKLDRPALDAAAHSYSSIQPVVGGVTDSQKQDFALFDT